MGAALSAWVSCYRLLMLVEIVENGDNIIDAIKDTEPHWTSSNNHLLCKDSRVKEQRLKQHCPCV